ncbi:hypothetical protein AURDEDRAFT_141448 [Auricularia subglabra TFB-10046 SS5]|nr:hypothetical protein AURDEDRAFT_141448 [Auricularia subglabra TFB-10046 SS5]
MAWPSLANRIDSSHRVVVVEQNDSYQHLFNFPRYSALPPHPSHTARAFVPFTGVPESCPAGALEWVTSRAVDVLPAEDATGDSARGFVKLADGTFVPYYYLIVATGADNSRLKATTAEDGCAELQQRAEKVAVAQTVLVIGGGAYGVELATDIATQYGDAKTVVLVHSHDQLLDRFGPQLHAAAMRRCRAVGVRVVLGERPEGWVDGEAGSITLRTTGETIVYDVAMKCVGGGSQKATSSLRSLLPASSFNARDGRLRTTNTLQVVDAPDGAVFALGDVCDPGMPDVPKMGRAAYTQSKFVAENVLRLIAHEGKSGQPTLRSYAPALGDNTIKLTLGLWDASMWMRVGDVEWAPMTKLRSLDLDAKTAWRLFGVGDKYPAIEGEKA